MQKGISNKNKFCAVKSDLFLMSSKLPAILINPIIQRTSPIRMLIAMLEELFQKNERIIDEAIVNKAASTDTFI